MLRVGKIERRQMIRQGKPMNLLSQSCCGETEQGGGGTSHTSEAGIHSVLRRQ